MTQQGNPLTATGTASHPRKEQNMKKRLQQAFVVTAAGMMVLAGTSAWAATNTATDPGGGGVSLLSSGAVTVNSSALQLVKQVWNGAGTLCLASQPADPACNASATTVTVPAGTGLQFLIYAKNTSDVALTDVRFQDALDISATGFTYAAGTIKRTANDGTAPADTDTAALIHTAAAAGTLQTDALGAPDDFASYVAGNLTVGAVTGQANQILGFPAHKSFGVVFNVTKK